MVTAIGIHQGERERSVSVLVTALITGTGVMVNDKATKKATRRGKSLSGVSPTMRHEVCDQCSISCLWRSAVLNCLRH